jgi:hypothetical protein
MNPRLKLLLGLLAAALAVLVWNELKPQADRAAGASSLDRQIDGGAARRPSAAARARARKGEAPVTSISELHLADLEPASGAFHAGRNPFAFVLPPPPPPPPEPPPPTPEEIAAREAAAEAARKAAEEAAAIERARPKPPIITFTYLGSFGPPERRIAVLSSGETTYNAMVGDIIEGKFRLEAIGYESVDIGYVDFPELPPQQLAVGEEGS